MSLKTQGILFSVLAWCVIALSNLLPTLNIHYQFIILAPVILLLGVPHGAFDTIFIRQTINIKTLTRQIFVVFLYLLIAAIVVYIWWLFPGFALAIFLLISAIHFSGDPENNVPKWFRLLYGCAVILSPFVFYSRDVLEIFIFLSGIKAATLLVNYLEWLSFPWLGMSLLAGLFYFRTNFIRGFELISMVSLLTFTPPLLGFTIYFCFMHSARHILRTRDYANIKSLSILMKTTLLPMIVVVAFALIFMALSTGESVEARLAQLLFIGLAGLTVPHMLVIERIRFSGWKLGKL
ncbi:Brp/Blh family beta-carotene 15,15'-dioxygenase [Polynucleobacter antarcticus]|uniref:Probable beta-carotene 15,15'-dioxygenase n=1 Tax=Polynucleobacter antarcticus TaxID=1743162 RepID=A0A6M9Q1L2_9BURK|nr:Brp/Blh family beta-carotene 15,15'-dioxygenase [Polynucleobacter antarcticus]QKM62143.1 hypothetical protein DCO16_03050 [Polynucleobacter antarcticus]